MTHDFSVVQRPYRIRAAVALALGAAAMMASTARVSAANNSAMLAANQATAANTQSTPAPSSAAPVTLEEVTVTGTRIKRRDLQSLSPIVTIDASQLKQRADANVEDYLNTMPQFNTAQAPTTEAEDVQPSATNTVGIATVSVRGLGANRTLTLINGHRVTPADALMDVNINMIPTSMIDRVETVTGGESAVYGADAMAGVVNFILKKHFNGVQFNVQDSEAQAGDGNQLDANVLLGTSTADGKGNFIMGMEYFNQEPAYQRNRSFYTNAWSDPNALSTNDFNFTSGHNGFFTGLAAPSAAAMNAVFPGRAGSPVCGFGSGCAFETFNFNPGGSMYTTYGNIHTSGYNGPTAGGGYGVMNSFDSTQANLAGFPAPNEVQSLKYNNPWTPLSEPQTRYSFYAHGTYDLTDNVQFYTDANFANSRTTTFLAVPMTAIFGWEASIPFNATTDSPINPSLISASTSAAQLQAMSAAFTANPTSNPYTNPNYIAPGKPGAQHPVPWQLATLLLSRGATPTSNGVPGAVQFGHLSSTLFGGPAICNPTISPKLCSQAPTSWILAYTPTYADAQRTTMETDQEWQIRTGFTFPIYSDWTGDIYYSRGQSQNYEQGLGTQSLERYRAVMDSPDYGAGDTFQGNYSGASQYFGTSVPTTCTSGFYDAIFGAPGTSPSSDCLNAIDAPLQTYTAMQQDDVEADFNGSLFKLPAGEVSAALGFEYLRDAGQFQPDNLQSTNSFLDQAIGLYPLGIVNNEIASHEGYGELFVPILSDKPFIHKLALDIGGRYASYNSNIPNAKTYKLNANWQINRSFQFRGGFNSATRAPNLGELYLGEEEYFGGGAAYGDPCSVRSTAPFGAGGAAPDYSAGSGKPGVGAPTALAGGQTAAGAMSTYLICQAMMGGAPPTATNPAGTGGAGQYYTQTNQGTGPGGTAAAATFAWLNQVGNPNLQSETADTWSAGFVFQNLGDNPWISGLSGSVDWWQIHIDHAIELESPDYANYLCYGTATVTNLAQAAAQAASPACQNVPRNTATGGAMTSLLQYNNLATIGISGIDLGLNWFAQLQDLGLHVPGGVSFSTQDTFLDYYRTKASSQTFDVNTNWKGSLGPTLAGTNPGAYSYRLTSNFGYVLPSVTVNLTWMFFPSVNTAAHAMQQAIIQHDQGVVSSGKGTLLSWVPNTDVAAPAYSLFDLFASWNISKHFQLRGGIDNLFNTNPPITGATMGYPGGTNLNGVCSAAEAKVGCVNPTSYALPNDGAGVTNAGFYDVFGRTFFLGFQVTF